LKYLKERFVHYQRGGQTAGSVSKSARLSVPRLLFRWQYSSSRRHRK
jgi:hypothetical protein